MLIILCLFSTIAGEIWSSKNKEKHWYLGLNLIQNITRNFRSLKSRVLFCSSLFLAWEQIGYTFLTFFILYNNLIPISLQITVDLVKFIQAYFINWVCSSTDNRLHMTFF